MEGFFDRFLYIFEYSRLQLVTKLRAVIIELLRAYSIQDNQSVGRQGCLLKEVNVTSLLLGKIR